MVQFNLHWQIEREGPAQVGDGGSSLKYIGRLSTDSLSVLEILISLSATELSYNKVPRYQKKFFLIAGSPLL